MRIDKGAVLASITLLSGVARADPDRGNGTPAPAPDPITVTSAVELDLAGVARAPAALGEHEVLWARGADAEARIFAAHGLVLAAGARYEPVGFSLRPALVPRLRLERRGGQFMLAAQAAVSQSVVDGQRSGVVSLDAVRSLGPHGLLGLRGSAAFDLERDADDPVGETDLELRAEPWLGLCQGPALLFVAGGPVLSRLRFEQTRRGTSAETGLAFAF
jgi:hypothetical protein